MAYPGVDWQNKPSTASPINRTNLEIMDNGIADNDRAITKVNSVLSGIGSYKSLQNESYVGTINTGTGGNMAATNRIRTEKKINPIAAYTDSPFMMMIHAYSKSGTYIGVLKQNGNFETGSSNIELVSEYIFASEYDYRIVIKRQDDSDLTISDATNLHVGYATDEGLTESNKAADARIVGKILDYQNAFSTFTNFSVGTLNASNGENMTSTTRLRTNVIIKPIKVIADSGYTFRVYAYTGSTYEGTYQTDGTVQKTSTYIADFTELTLSDSYDGYKFVLRKTNDGTITESEKSHLHFCFFSDSSLTLKNKAADSAKVGEKLSNINTSIDNILNGLSEGVIQALFINGLDEFSQGKAINSSGAIITEGTSYAIESYLEINKETKIISDLAVVSSSPGYYQYVFFYDSSKTYLSRVGGSKQNVILASIPDNAKYFRVSLTYVTIGNVSSYSCYKQYYMTNVATPKNKWYVFGDSISAGYFSITDEEAEEKGYTISYRPAGLEGVGAVWMSDLSHNYWGYANEWFLKRNLQPRAYPGQGYLKISADNMNGILKVKNTDVSDAGLITVAWGFNDWHYNQPRGTRDLIDPSVPYPTEGYDTSQITTVNQAIWYCLGELIRKAPLAKIVVQTPMNGWLYGGDWDSWWGLNTRMSNSGTLAEIHDDIKYWADYYGLQVLDMTYNNSIVNRKNIKDVLLDGSHPSDPAHMQLGRHVGIALKYM